MKTDLIPILKKGGIGVMATDTIYGVVGSALDKNVVERVYKIRKRDPKKPFLILISSFKDLKKFDVDLKAVDIKVIKKHWPGKVTIILPLTESGLLKFKYLHRGRGTLAFRLPSNIKLIQFLKKAGPLVAPSANISGGEPSRNIGEARKYFGDKVDFYEAGRVSKKASKIIALQDGRIKLIRK